MQGTTFRSLLFSNLFIGLRHMNMVPDPKGILIVIQHTLVECSAGGSGNRICKHTLSLSSKNRSSPQRETVAQYSHCGKSRAAVLSVLISTACRQWLLLGLSCEVPSRPGGYLPQIKIFLRSQSMV